MSRMATKENAYVQEIHDVGRGQTHGRDQHSADGGTDDHAEAAAQGAKDRRRRQLVLVHEPRRHGLQRRSLQPAQRGHPGRGHEQRPHVRPGQQRVQGEEAAADREADVGGEHDAPPVHPVRERARR